MDVAGNAKADKRLWTQKGLALKFRERSPAIDFALSGVDGFLRHRTGLYASLLAYYGFISVFPLLAAFTTILGFVLQNNEELQKTIVDSAFANIPFIGSTIQSNPADIHGSVIVLVLSLATSLWAGTRAFVVAQTSMNDIWEVPEADRPKQARKRLLALAAIMVVGTDQIVSGYLSGVIGVGDQGPVRLLVLVAIAISVNIVALGVSYRILVARPLDRRQVMPGAIAGGLVFSVFQVIGGSFVTRSIKRASPIYGSFATVIALLAWLSLHAMVALIGLEANAALDNRRKKAATDSAAVEPSTVEL